MERKIVWESSSAKIIQVAENEYEVYALSTRNEDGIVVKDWNFLCIYTNTYSRDWLGNVHSTYYNPSNESDYAYRKAKEYALKL